MAPGPGGKCLNQRQHQGNAHPDPIFQVLLQLLHKIAVTSLWIYYPTSQLQLKTKHSSSLLVPETQTVANSLPQFFLCHPQWPKENWFSRPTEEVNRLGCNLHTDHPQECGSSPSCSTLVPAPCQGPWEERLMANYLGPCHPHGTLRLRAGHAGSEQSRSPSLSLFLPPLINKFSNN